MSSAPARGSAGDAGVRISINTPQGVRAKQVVDMLNSDWPIGPIGIKTLAAPNLVDYVGTVMDNLWWERPYRAARVDIRAGAATLHLSTSYGARQDIELHTGDDTLVDRFTVTTVPPVIHSWADVDAALANIGGRYSTAFPASSTAAASSSPDPTPPTHCPWRPSSSCTSSTPWRTGSRPHRVLGRPVDHHRRGQDRRLVGVRQDARRHKISVGRPLER
jgi:hypothetical protein